jgi:hypothetical protein
VGRRLGSDDAFRHLPKPGGGCSLTGWLRC